MPDLTISPLRTAASILMLALAMNPALGHPTVPAHSMVANVNLDMPTHIADVTDLIPIDTEHSTLEPIAREAVTAAGLTLTPDPMPDNDGNFFGDKFGRKR